MKLKEELVEVGINKKKKKKKKFETKNRCVELTMMEVKPIIGGIDD